MTAHTKSCQDINSIELSFSNKFPSSPIYICLLLYFIVLINIYIIIIYIYMCVYICIYIYKYLKCLKYNVNYNSFLLLFLAYV